jgi:hypothetical protein
MTGDNDPFSNLSQALQKRIEKIVGYPGVREILMEVIQECSTKDGTKKRKRLDKEWIYKFPEFRFLHPRKKCSLLIHDRYVSLSQNELVEKEMEVDVGIVVEGSKGETIVSLLKGWGIEIDVVAFIKGNESTETDVITSLESITTVFQSHSKGIPCYFKTKDG